MGDQPAPVAELDERGDGVGRQVAVVDRRRDLDRGGRLQDGVDAVHSYVEAGLIGDLEAAARRWVESVAATLRFAEKGKVVEFGTHAELMALNGRYRTMFDLQAQRFTAEDEEGRSYDVLA